MGYVQSLTRAGRDSEVPRYVIVSDFATIVLHDLESTDPHFESVSFPVQDLHQHVRLFDFLNGIQSKPADPEDPINIDAVTVLGDLHDALEAGGYVGPKLERFLVRVLFCLFADDTGIFEPDTFKSVVEQSREHGSDLGPQLDRFFRVLDTPDAERSAKLPDELKPLPYVNGNLFAERLDLADFDTPMRTALLAACRFQWAKISPAVFGSLFQSILASDAGKKKRRQIGAHYTSERDILKLVRSLFLDDLRSEFERLSERKLEADSIASARQAELRTRQRSDKDVINVRARRQRVRRKLEEFHNKLASLKFLDPACGCGNFLVVAYREVRRLELEVISDIFDDQIADLRAVIRLDVDCMHGIEIEEWPARIAEVAMWLIDHQMNLEASQKFGKPLLRLPLKKTAKIHNGNALRTDWNDVLPAKDCAFVMGNALFSDAHGMDEADRRTVEKRLSIRWKHGLQHFSLARVADRGAEAGRREGCAGRVGRAGGVSGADAGGLVRPAGDAQGVAGRPPGARPGGGQVLPAAAVRLGPAPGGVPLRFVRKAHQPLPRRKAQAGEAEGQAARPCLGRRPRKLEDVRSCRGDARVVRRLHDTLVDDPWVAPTKNAAWVAPRGVVETGMGRRLTARP